MIVTASEFEFYKSYLNQNIFSTRSIKYLIKL